MLSTPLTPPAQSSNAELPHEASLPLEVSSSENSQHYTSILTPVSIGGSGLDDHEEELVATARSHTHDTSDDDQDTDMSDGGVPLSSLPVGVPLTMSISDTEETNTGMDLLDVELIGGDNFHNMFHNHIPTSQAPPFFFSDTEDQPDHVLDENLYTGPPHQAPELPAAQAGLPAAISNLSQQLQHIQEGQEHGDFAVFQDPLHGTENSTSPFQFVSAPVPNAFSMNNTQSTPVQFHTQLIPILSVNGLGGYAVSPPLLETVETQPILPTIVQPLPQEPHFQNVFQDNSDVMLDDDNSEADQASEVEAQHNMSLIDFLTSWARASSWEEEARRRPRGPDLHSVLRQRDMEDLEPMERGNLQGERCDIQRMDWKDLGVTRFEARQMRRQTYKNYMNLRGSNTPAWHPRLNGVKLSDDMDYFKFRRMDFDQDVHLSHFQLRNLLACASRDHIFYAGRSKVLHYTPVGGHDHPAQPTVAMDLTTPTVQVPGFTGGIQISTITIAHNILVAGGFCGEYAIANLRAEKTAPHSEGILTDHNNAITNHVQVHLSRHSSLPLATFASNDNGLRSIDVSTNRTIAHHKYDVAINCSAISPDQRLRVLVGDTQKVMICNSETGEILQELDGHRDFGFACDWADDGWTVATGNQDTQVKIWDARKWKTSSGISCPVATVAAEMAGVRKLKFSPVGSGKRVLVAAEPADFISVIDAQTFTSKQSLSFFGEIGGVDFTNDGQDLIVANCDPARGGIMQFERCGLGPEGPYQDQGTWDKSNKRRIRVGPGGYDWQATDEDVTAHPKSRRTQMHRVRQSAQLGLHMPIF